MQLRTGALIANKYEIERVIGCGGMGTVYRCLQVEFGRAVAIKLLHAGAIDDKQYARFEREAAVMNTLMHRNIVTFYAFGMHAGAPYIVTEFLPGQTLEKVLFENGPMDVKCAVKLATQICSALSCAHSNGIIHRDLKPSNLILTESSGDEMTVKLVDFGLAKIHASPGVESQKLTDVGMTVGTTQFMSPEQFMGSNVDARSDVYSLGCVLYYCLTGMPPFDGTNSVIIMAHHMNTMPAPLREVLRHSSCPNLDRMQEIIDRAMSKDISTRYQSAQEMLNDLNALQTHSQKLVNPKSIASARPKAARRPSRRNQTSRLTLACLIAVFGLSLSSIWFYLQSLHRPKTNSLAIFMDIARDKERLRYEIDSPLSDIKYASKKLELALTRDKTDGLLNSDQRITALSWLANFYDWQHQPKEEADALRSVMTYLHKTKSLVSRDNYWMVRKFEDHERSLVPTKYAALYIGKLLALPHPPNSSWGAERYIVLTHYIWLNLEQNNYQVAATVAPGLAKSTDDIDALTCCAYTAFRQGDLERTRSLLTEIAKSHLAPTPREAAVIKLLMFQLDAADGKWDNAEVDARGCIPNRTQMAPNLILRSREGKWNEAHSECETIRAFVGSRLPYRFYRCMNDLALREYARLLRKAGRVNDAEYADKVYDELAAKCHAACTARPDLWEKILE